MFYMVPAELLAQIMLYKVGRETRLKMALTGKGPISRKGRQSRLQVWPLRCG